jgi:hypothetical protein
MATSWSALAGDAIFRMTVSGRSATADAAARLLELFGDVGFVAPSYRMLMRIVSQMYPPFKCVLSKTTPVAGMPLARRADRQRPSKSKESSFAAIFHVSGFAKSPRSIADMGPDARKGARTREIGADAGTPAVLKSKLDCAAADSDGAFGASARAAAAGAAIPGARRAAVASAAVAARVVSASAGAASGSAAAVASERVTLTMLK